MARSGRPRKNRELEKARAKIIAHREGLKNLISLIPQKAENKKTRVKGAPRTAHRRAWRAAQIRLTLERGTRNQKDRCKQKIAQLRAWARVNGPRDPSLDDCEFLEQFIKKHAPNWKFRDFLNDGTLAEQDDKITKDFAWLDLQDKARTDRFVTANEPDAGWLSAPRRLIPNDPTTWPTLRELKLATAIPERIIKKIVASSAPKKAEIVRKPLRHLFSKRGAPPKRYGPRLVLSVLNEFLKRLPSYSMGDAEREHARKAAMTTKRSLAAKLASSRSGAYG
jgi:hypothetical protein